MTTIRTIIGSSPRTAALIGGSVTSDRVQLEIEVAQPVTAAFRKVANDLAYDAGELAVVTYLIAREQAKPLRLLPVVLATQPELPTLLAPENSPIHAPADLARKHVATRSYSQTTAVWMRGIIDELAGVGSSIRWSASEVSHVDGYTDPNGVGQLGEVSAIDAMRSGAIDAALTAAADGLRVALDGAAEIEAGWRASTGILPANHFLCVQQHLLDEDGVTEALIDLFARSKAAGAVGDIGDPEGAEAIAATLDRVGLFAHRQGITSRQWTAAEMLA